MKGEVTVLQPGLYTTIQDLGRTGFQKYGVPCSGVLDKYAAKIANLILRNKANDAVLEITMMGPKLRFEQSGKIAISGGYLSPKLNKSAIENNEVYCVKSGDVLSFGQRKKGARCYLAIYGGFKTEEVLNSKSWYQGISRCGRVKKGSVLNFEPTTKDVVVTNASINYNQFYLNSEEIEVYRGPEYNRLDINQQKIIENKEFHIGNDNSRMAYQLEETLKNHLEPIITGAVLPGTIQLTPSGKLIILMKDCQTTGGYPRILQVSESSLNKLAQKFTNDKLRFVLK